MVRLKEEVENAKQLQTQKDELTQKLEVRTVLKDWKSYIYICIKVSCQYGFWMKYTLNWSKVKTFIMLHKISISN